MFASAYTLQSHFADSQQFILIGTVVNLQIKLSRTDILIVMALSSCVDPAFHQLDTVANNQGRSAVKRHTLPQKRSGGCESSSVIMLLTSVCKALASTRERGKLGRRNKSLLDKHEDLRSNPQTPQKPSRGRIYFQCFGGEMRDRDKRTWKFMDQLAPCSIKQQGSCFEQVEGENPHPRESSGHTHVLQHTHTVLPC